MRRFGIESCERRFQADEHCTVAASSDTTRSTCGRIPEAVLAKHACSGHISRLEPLAVEAVPHEALISECGTASSYGEDLAALRKPERSGRPLGQVSFVECLEENLARTLSPQKRGPKSRSG